eukprot:3374151-Amphidinium_carterae.1
MLMFALSYLDQAGGCPIPGVKIMQYMGIPIGAHPFTTHALNTLDAKVRGCLWAIGVNVLFDLSMFLAKFA